MIASLRGKLLDKSAAGLIVECGGVGYGLAASLATLSRLGAEGSEVFLWVHTHASQDSLRLYGFGERSERRAFEVLIGTSGVGPRLAIAILSFLTPGELSVAVETADKGMLVRVPGVGAKKAARLLVELKGRLDPAEVGTGTAAAPASDVSGDLVSALVNLGFAPKDADKVAAKVVDANAEETDLATLVREALRSAR